MDERWIPFAGHTEQEDELGAIFFTIENENKTRIRIKNGDYRFRDGVIEIRVGLVAEWIDPSPTCRL